ncbi:MAG: hypothetical protein LBG52_00695 [Candidatus Peribacteria bacterium]|jgi:hypothetical protein|nr:hypothetical protein [Candidatus Peribacteria bacterium]
MTALSQPEFYNELVTITQMKFSELDEEQPYFYSVVGFRFMESLTQALMFSSLYYTETNQPDVAMQYILLAYKLNKSFATMHTSLTDFRIALEMQKLCKNVVHYWMTKYSDVAAASEWWNVYRENDILLYLSDHYETRRQQITASEYQSLVNELQERGYKYHVHANNRL